jgi:hypothetical protein
MYRLRGKKMPTQVNDAQKKTEPLARPLVAVMAPSPKGIAAVLPRLIAIYGELCSASDSYLFDEYTHYYEKEFGRGLVKQVFVFSTLREQALLADDKVVASSIERESADPTSGKRLVNIDPGFITLSKLVLASTKDHAHRLYLGEGIYGEITLAWKGRSFERHPWSYPDYVSLIPFLNAARTQMQQSLVGIDAERAR